MTARMLRDFQPGAEKPDQNSTRGILTFLQFQRNTAANVLSQHPFNVTDMVHSTSCTPRQSRISCSSSLLIVVLWSHQYFGDDIIRNCLWVHDLGRYVPQLHRRLDAALSLSLLPETPSQHVQVAAGKDNSIGPLEPPSPRN